jgi:hypothetical protein
VSFAWPYNSAVARVIFAKLLASRRRVPEPRVPWSVEWERLLEWSGAYSAEDRREAGEAVAALEKRQVVFFKPGVGKTRRVTVPVTSETDWFEAFNERHPRLARLGVADFTREAATWRHGLLGERWRDWCLALADAMTAGKFQSFVDRHNEADWRETLPIFSELTGRAWPAGTLVRAASAEIAADSKWIDDQRPRLERMLRALAQDKMSTLADIGLADPPRLCIAHGPLRLNASGAWLDFGLLRSPYAVGEQDIEAGEVSVRMPARVLTVENETTFHQLAQLASGELLIHTSYPGSATLALVRALPADCECWHFGDSDPQGFDILRDLRERTRRSFRALAMRYRERSGAPALTSREKRLAENLKAHSGLFPEEQATLQAILAGGSKGDFEQERLPLTRAAWPFGLA